MNPLTRNREARDHNLTDLRKPFPRLLYRKLRVSITLWVLQASSDESRIKFTVVVFVKVRDTTSEVFVFIKKESSRQESNTNVGVTLQGQ